MRLRPPRTRDVIGAFLAARADLAPSTLSKYRWVLAHLANAHQSLPHRPQPLETLLATLPHAPATRDTFWRTFSTLYRWTALHFAVPNPMPHVRRPHRPRTIRRTLSDDELSRLLDLHLSRRDRALIHLFLDTGLRLGEVATLTWDNVRGDHLIVHGKTGWRTVPVSGSTIKALIGLGDSHYIWLGQRGPLTPWGVKLAVRRILADIGVHGGPHLLRHTVGRQWLRNGGDLRSLQALLGHSNIATTALYTALDDRDLQDKHARFSPIAQRTSLVL